MHLVCGTCSSFVAIAGLSFVEAYNRCVRMGTHLTVAMKNRWYSSRIVASMALFFASSGSLAVERRWKTDLQSTNSFVICFEETSSIKNCKYLSFSTASAAAKSSAVLVLLTTRQAQRESQLIV